MSDFFDPISETIRQNILQAALAHIAFEGWTDKALAAAVRDLDLPMGSEALYFPSGATELLRFWAEQINDAAREKIIGRQWGQTRIRDKITQSIILWLSEFNGHETAARRALARLSLPDRFGQGPAQLWSSADMIWRAIGDTSTDGNFYSKRLTLSGVLVASLMSWLADDSDDKARARVFIDQRIENVMQFEKLKAGFRKKSQSWQNPAEVLGRLRYGSSARRRRRRRY